MSNAQTQSRALQVLKHFQSMLGKRVSVSMASKQQRAYAVSLWRFPDSSAWLTRAEQKHSLALTWGSTAKFPLHPRAMLVGKGWMMLLAPRRALGCGPPAAPSRHCQLCSRAAVGQEGEGAVAAPEISCVRWRPCGVSAVS